MITSRTLLAGVCGACAAFACCPTFAALALPTGTYVSIDRPKNVEDALANGSVPVDVWEAVSPGPGAVDRHSTSTANALSGVGGAGSSGGIDDSDGRAWRLTSPPLTLAAATAAFAAPLAAGDFAAIDFDNGALEFASQAAVRFQDGAGVTRAALIAFGGSPTYQFFDNSGITSSPIPITADGLSLKFDFLGNGAYSLAVKDLASGTTFSRPGFVLGGLAAPPIQGIQVLAQGTGAHPANSVFFNNLTLDIAGTTAIPEASPLLTLPAIFALTSLAARRRTRRGSTLIA